ncbi:MAG: hypothetical protein KC431_07010, partial [Myxococcales bacterium]|nr:hypothetical protein [Myxococcales bacterium]
VVVRVNDGRLWHLSWDGAWSTWRQIPQVVVESDPALGSAGPELLDVFVRATDGSVTRVAFTDGSWDAGAGINNGGLIVGAPAVAVSTAGRIHLVALGTNAQIWATAAG